MDSTTSEVAVFMEIVQLLREEVRHLKLQIEEVRLNTSRTFEEVYFELDGLKEDLQSEIQDVKNMTDQKTNELHELVSDVNGRCDGIDGR
jgi:chromosome segregation ATPase